MLGTWISLAALVPSEPFAEDIADAEGELAALTATVDRFYELLGSRNWVLASQLSWVKVTEAANQGSLEAAERVLLDYLNEETTLPALVHQVSDIEGMRPRIPLLLKAATDFHEGRYYSSTLVVLTVADGFINDSERHIRKGLFARSPESMHEPLTVATVWQGLPSVLQTVTRSFRQRVDEPVHEPYRHGILHGMVVDYDNELVAAKAWCLLLGACDWAREKANVRPKTEGAPNLLKAIQRDRESQAEWDARRAQWSKHPVDLKAPVDSDRELLESVQGFLEAWFAGNYGRLSEYFANYSHSSQGQLAGQARECYQAHPLDNHRILSIARPAPATASVTLELVEDSHPRVTVLRFTRIHNGTPAADWEPGTWKLMMYQTAPFIASPVAVTPRRES